MRQFSSPRVMSTFIRWDAARVTDVAVLYSFRLFVKDRALRFFSFLS